MFLVFRKEKEEDDDRLGNEAQKDRKKETDNCTCLQLVAVLELL